MLWSLTTDVGEATPWHEHEIFEFVLCRSHGGRLLWPGGDVALRPARTLLVPPGTRHRFLFGPGEAGRLKFICLPPSDLPGFLSPAQLALLEGFRGGGVSAADHPGRQDWLDRLADKTGEDLRVTAHFIRQWLAGEAVEAICR